MRLAVNHWIAKLEDRNEDWTTAKAAQMFADIVAELHSCERELAECQKARTFWRERFTMSRLARLDVRYSCSDAAHHAHRTRLGAFVCFQTQRLAYRLRMPGVVVAETLRWSGAFVLGFIVGVMAILSFEFLVGIIPV